MNTTYTVRISDRLDAKLQLAWDELWKRAENPGYFNTSSWTDIYIRVFNPAKIRICCLFEGSTLVAIAPFVYERRYGIGVYHFPGSEYAHRASWLYSLPLKMLVPELTSEFQKMSQTMLEHLDDQEAMVLRKYDENYAVIGTSISPTLPLVVDANRQVVISKKNQILKKARTLMDALKVERFSGSAAPTAMKIVEEIDQQSVKQKYGYNVFSTAKTVQFYTELASECPDTTAINILSLNKEPVAYEIGVVHADAYLDCERAYKVSAEEYTAGKVILVSTIETATQLGVHTYDFGPGIDNLKKSLAKEEHAYTQIAYFQNRYLLAYLRGISVLRERIYAEIFRHKNIYSLYKRISAR